MRSSRHMLAFVGSSLALATHTPARKSFDSIAKPKPYEGNVAKVKRGKSARRQRIKAKCIQRIADYYAWVNKYNCLMPYKQWCHPQMRAECEARSGVTA